MSDDKIKISWDDLGHSDSPKPQQPSYVPPPDTKSYQTPPTYSPYPQTSPSSDNTKWIIGGIIAAVLVIGLLGYCLLRGNSSGGIIAPPRQTVEEYCQQEMASGNAELAKSDNPVRKYIEDAHLTVTVYSAKIKSLTVETLDGSNYADNGKNISTITTQLEFHWDGIFHKGGTTILECVYDCISDKILRAEIVYTDALINTEDPEFWYTVGYLGAMMLL